MPKATYKKREDGRFRVKYKGKDFYGATQSEAVAKREAYKRQLAQGLREETLGLYFGQYAVDWITTYKAGCSDKTYNDYVSIVNRLIDHFGAMRMQAITQMDVQAYVNTLEGRSTSSIKKYRMVLNGIFRSAYNDRIVLSNPTLGIKPPKGTSGTHRTITDEERRLIHLSVGHHDMALPAIIMLYAGLRRGEVMALDASCIDWNNQRINVRNGITFPRNQPVLTTPKTAAGIRSVPMFPPVKQALRGISGLVISRESGDYMSQVGWRKKWDSYRTYLETVKNGCTKRWYGKTKEHKAIIAAGGSLPPWWECTIQPHDLRHSYVTMLYDKNIDLKTAIKWVGHEDTTMIMRIYAHLTEQREKIAEQEVAKHVENLIWGSQQGSENDETPIIKAKKRL